MRRKKGAVWAVVIAAALITAGLILSCGDDNGGNGEPEVTCEEICEKIIDECEFFGGTVAGCVEDCEEGFGVGEEMMEVFECTVDVRCGYIALDCFCKAYCDRIFYCELIDDYELLDCMLFCGIEWAEGEEEYVMSLTMCALENSCGDIEAECW